MNITPFSSLHLLARNKFIFEITNDDLAPSIEETIQTYVYSELTPGDCQVRIGVTTPKGQYEVVIDGVTSNLLQFSNDVYSALNSVENLWLTEYIYAYDDGSTTAQSGLIVIIKRDDVTFNLDVLTTTTLDAALTTQTKVNKYEYPTNGRLELMLYKMTPPYQGEVLNPGALGTGFIPLQYSNCKAYSYLSQTPALKLEKYRFDLQSLLEALVEPTQDYTVNSIWQQQYPTVAIFRYVYGNQTGEYGPFYVNDGKLQFDENRDILSIYFHSLLAPTNTPNIKQERDFNQTCDTIKIDTDFVVYPISFIHGYTNQDYEDGLNPAETWTTQLRIVGYDSSGNQSQRYKLLSTNIETYQKNNGIYTFDMSINKLFTEIQQIQFDLGVEIDYYEIKPVKYDTQNDVEADFMSVPTIKFNYYEQECGLDEDKLQVLFVNSMGGWEAAMLFIQEEQQIEVEKFITTNLNLTPSTYQAKTNTYNVKNDLVFTAKKFHKDFREYYQIVEMVKSERVYVLKNDGTGIKKLPIILEDNTTAYNRDANYSMLNFKFDY